MVSDNTTGLRRNARIGGFSLIELLVVIAIIALLAAIIFPVFATVRENGRQSSSMSNLHDISVKMEQYRLDTQHYPPVLFGYVKPGVGMDKVLDACQADGSCGTYLTGLYPEYVKSWTEFEDPNNTAKTTDTASANTTYLCGDSDTSNGCTAAGQLVIQTAVPTYYAADAYDVSPQVTGVNAVSKTMVTRYLTSWSSIDKSLDCAQAPNDTKALSEQFCTSPNPPSSAANLYLDQLRWRNPPSNTYVTCTTYHVQQAGIVLVLTQDGSVKKVDAGKFSGFDKATQHSIDGNGVDAANFWKIML